MQTLRVPIRQWPKASLSFGLLRLLDSLAAAVLVVNENGTVLLANPRAADLLDYDQAELEGVDVSRLIAPLSVLLDAPTAKGHSRSTRRIRLRDGRVRDVGYTASPVELAAQTTTAYALVFQDITELLSLQEQRDRLLKLATVGEALPSLLHELKNPLAAIASSVELLIEDATDGRLQADLHAVLTEVRRTVLSLDGIGSVGRDLVSSSLNAVDLAVREACSVLKSRAQSAGVTLRNEDSTLPLLWLDASVIRAVVFNLVTNAIHACSDGGSVEVGCRLIDGGNVFELCVRDDGAGMSQEVRQRCTELFFTTKRSGSGIGLALCKQIAEGAQGSLEIESTEGKGTCVCIRVPLPKPPVSRGRGDLRS